MKTGFALGGSLRLLLATMALGVDWRLAAIALLPFPLMAWSFAWISRHVHDAHSGPATRHSLDAVRVKKS